MLRSLLHSESGDLSRERMQPPHESELVGLLDARHQQDALEIWKGLANLAHLNQFELGQRVALIHTAADQIMRRESTTPAPSPQQDRRELAHLFRTAAAAIASCSSSLESAAESGAPLLKHARRLEACFS